MAHIHKIQKIKGQTDFDANGAGYIVVANIAGRAISVGSPSIVLYPGDKAFSCDDNDLVLSAVKGNKLAIVETFESKPKPKKQKQEETLVTVADSEEEVSVQLGMSDEGEEPLGDIL